MFTFKIFAGFADGFGSVLLVLTTAIMGARAALIGV